MLGIFPLFLVKGICPHSWKRLTSDNSYGNAFSKHWGNYHGATEDECRLCGEIRTVSQAEIDEEIAKKNGEIPPSIRALKPWKRGTYGFGMKPNNNWNCTGTFCDKCGDWIEDGAYNSEHGTLKCPRPGSWNYENPKYKRSSDKDIVPNHAEWLDDMREWAKKNKGHTFGQCGGIYIGPKDHQFHSHAEARAILEPYGIEVSEDGLSMGGGFVVRRRAGVMADYGSGPVKDKLTKKEIAYADKINRAYIKKHGKLHA